MSIAVRLDGINRTLEKLNETAQTALDLARKPKNKARDALEIVVLVAGAFAILSSAEIIRQWLMGG